MKRRAIRTPAAHLPRPTRRLGVLALAGLLLFGTACTERQNVSGAGPLPVQATAYPSPEGDRNVPVAKDPPQDIQELRITVTSAGFEADRYEAQARATRLVVTAQGGPYTVSVDKLLQPRELAANSTTDIALTLPDPGLYTMQLSGGATDTAVLNVRAAGAR